MRFEQMRTILQHLAPNYHHTVSQFYQSLADGGVSPRVRLMLNYLVEHEQRRALALSEFCRDAAPHVLEYWFKGIEVNFPEAQADLLSDTAKTDLDELVKAAVNYKRTLIGYFAHLLEHCTEEDALYLIQTLKTQEEKAMKRMIRHAQGLADL